MNATITIVQQTKKTRSDLSNQILHLCVSGVHLTLALSALVRFASIERIAFTVWLSFGNLLMWRSIFSRLFVSRLAPER